MQASECPYCHSVRSILLGDVYCSQQQKKSMADLATGTLLIKSKKLEETCEHVSRLSIRCTLSGEQHYKAGGNDFLITPRNYLVVNRGQYYKTSFEADTEQEMILVAFQPGFAESLFYSLTNSTATLLDEPFGTHGSSVNFFEKTYDQDPVIHALFARLRKLIDADIALKKEMDLESIYSALLTRLLQVQLNIQKDINKLQETKLSTRVELYRRLSIAKDFADAHVGRKIRLEDISKAACLSIHHFKREFKILYGCTPHRYLFLKRMEKAQSLLGKNFLNIDDVAMACGFENTISFIRQFRGYTGNTPGQYRLLQQAS